MNKLNKIAKITLLSVASVGLLAGCGVVTQTVTKKPSAANQKPITMAFYLDNNLPNYANKINKMLQPVQTFLSKKSGLNVKFKVYFNENQEIADLKSGKLDVGQFDTLYFVKANQSVHLLPLIETTYGDGDGRFYRTQFIVPIHSKINSISQLIKHKGLTWANPGQTSTSGFLVPDYTFISMGIKHPTTYFKPVYTAGHHDAVFDVAQGKADFSTTYDNILVELKSIDPNIDKKVKTIGYSHWIPNDGFSILASEPKSVQTKLQQAILDMNKNKKFMQMFHSTKEWVTFQKGRVSDYAWITKIYNQIHK